MEERVVEIKCPCCGRKLFDMKSDSQGAISIKCSRCKTVMAVRMMGKNRIRVVPSK